MLLEMDQLVTNATNIRLLPPGRKLFRAVPMLVRAGGFQNKGVQQLGSRLGISALNGAGVVRVLKKAPARPPGGLHDYLVGRRRQTSTTDFITHFGSAARLRQRRF
jgi:hypothetical protein